MELNPFMPICTSSFVRIYIIWPLRWHIVCLHRGTRNVCQATALPHRLGLQRAVGVVLAQLPDMHQDAFGAAQRFAVTHAACASCRARCNLDARGSGRGQVRREPPIT